MLGGVVAVTALAIALDADRRLQTGVPGYVESLQEPSSAATPRERELARLRGERDGGRRHPASGELRRLRPGAGASRGIARLAQHARR